ncbi:MAG: ImmA/IrrE family metallo-endopeptidase [Verrucomicrobia bacterium]|nr:ImmA/IrrE family metallo-endopeptidase [Verrucomicrobiota bacterium]
MITNDRQYRISKAQAVKMRSAIEAFDSEQVAARVGSAILARAELDALRSEEGLLSEQLREYDALKSGAVTMLNAENLEELPSILIRARIARGLSQHQLAEVLGVKEQQIQRYESEEYASASLRRLSAVAEALELNVSEVAELRPQPPAEAPKRARDIDWALFPVKEMYRRGWFGDFVGSLAAAVENAEALAATFVGEALGQPALAMHRMRVRSGSVADPYSLLAWQCRVLSLAGQQALPTAYRHGTLDRDWLKALVKESRRPDGPLRAKQALAEVGTPLVVEPHLSQTFLDGAAFLHQGRPVVGLTLRYDRTDNFWFVLIHELEHVTRHLHEGRVEDIFDDLDAEGDALERETDELAGQVLIPEDRWETALARYVRSEQSVEDFAQELGVSPALVAGRIRKEADNYAILTGLVGQGEVRKYFPGVVFGQ